MVEEAVELGNFKTYQEVLNAALAGFVSDRVYVVGQGPAAVAAVQ